MWYQSDRLFSGLWQENFTQCSVEQDGSQAGMGYADPPDSGDWEMPSIE